MNAFCRPNLSQPERAFFFSRNKIEMDKKNHILFVIQYDIQICERNEFILYPNNGFADGKIVAFHFLWIRLCIFMIDKMCKKLWLNSTLLII